MPKHRKLVTIIWADLKSRQNIDAYVAILVGLVLGIFGLLGIVRFELLASGILLLISYAVWTTLVNRRAMTELTSYIEDTQWPSQILRFAEFPNNEIRDLLRVAKEISLSGLSFYRFFPLFFDDIKYALLNGAVLRVILADPNSGVAEMASFRSDTQTKPETERQRILNTLQFLSQQISMLPGIKIELRKCPYLAPYAITIVVPADPQAQIYCHARILPFRSPSLKAPVVMPNPDSDKLWFEFFLSQFENLWSASTKIDLSSDWHSTPNDPHNHANATDS